MLARSLRTKVCRAFAFTDAGADHLATSKADPRQPLVFHSSTTRAPAESTVSFTELENGVTVVSTSPEHSGNVNLQVLLNVGTADEDHKTSGSLLSIQNTYYKTVLITNEAINYGMVQMTGGNFKMDFDQESTLFNAQCLPHDVYDILGMTCDAALEPRSAVAAGIGMRANKATHVLEASLDTGLSYNDLLFRTAYGLKGLGMPLQGLPNNVEYLNAHTLQRFQVENITPNRIFVGGSNVENHNELVEIVQEKLGNIPAMDTAGRYVRKQAEYLGGEYRSETTSNRADITCVYPTQGWNNSKATALQVAATLLGEFNSLDAEVRAPSDVDFGRALNQVGAVNPHVDALSTVNFTFQNSGLFGLRVSGSASEAQTLVDTLKEQLQGMSSVTEAELTAAKSALRLRILRGLERPEDRLSESMRNLATFGEVVHPQYLGNIEAVTAEDVQDAVSELLRETPTVVAQGGQISRLRLNF